MKAKELGFSPFFWLSGRSMIPGNNFVFFLFFLFLFYIFISFISILLISSILISYSLFFFLRLIKRIDSLMDNVD
jgi:hypothetical protein